MRKVAYHHYSLTRSVRRCKRIFRKITRFHLKNNNFWKRSLIWFFAYRTVCYKCTSILLLLLLLFPSSAILLLRLTSQNAVVQLRGTTVHSKFSTKKNKKLETKTDICSRFSMSIPNQMKTSNRRVCKVSLYSRIFNVEMHVETKQIASNSCKQYDSNPHLIYLVFTWHEANFFGFCFFVGCRKLVNKNN